MKVFNDSNEEHRCLHKGTFIGKILYYILATFIFLSFTGCNNTHDNNIRTQNHNINTNDNSINTQIENTTTLPAYPTKTASQAATEEKNTSQNEVEVIESVPDIADSDYTVDVDYSDCFDGIEGCAVFLNSDTNVYNMYNEKSCQKRSSPNSTFKIISTLIGLENGVIDSVDSTMGYDGTIYSNDKWNKDLSLKEAFQESCVWYFRKVIDRVGQSQVKEWIDKLEYGNCDISEWAGNGINSLPELNGFWLDSSLQISPKEQVDIIAKIFEGKTDFSEKNVHILKEVMLTQKDGDVSVYGKTGTGMNANTRNMNNGWFVGLFENHDERYYFAVHLADEKSKDVWGPKAKEIALNIINKYYVGQ
jgi:bla regulator protein BlaR1